MIVTHANFANAIQELKRHKALSLDSETSGLRPFHGDTFFSLILATPLDQYYFNFNPDSGPPETQLGDDHLAILEGLVFCGSNDRVWFMHNAKFDLHMLETRGLHVSGFVHDTKVYARLLYNDHMAYSLAACAERIGLRKSTAVDEYIQEHGLWDWVDIPGRRTRDKALYFNRVPFDIISSYGEQDARITFDLGFYQLNELDKWEKERPQSTPSSLEIVTNERALLCVVYSMERDGVYVDKDYCLDGIRYETKRMNLFEKGFEVATGSEFKDSPKLFAQVLPQSSKKTKKSGADSYDYEALEVLAQSSEAAQLILDWRDAKKRLDFFNGFLHHSDTAQAIHANLDQAGTKTGRFTCSSPNLQQVTKEEDLASPYPIRRAIKPRADYDFFMFDYDQQEYRLMLDYAGVYVPAAERRLIEMIRGGLDVHQATADVASITRSEAKTTNFSILFGAGLDLLAARLKRTRAAAGHIKGAVLHAAPEIEVFLRSVASVAKNRGYVTNWFGRRWFCPDPKFAFRGPNFICQGGGADVIKVAMVRVGLLLERAKARSRLVLQVHDEIVLEVHKDEHDLVPQIRAIMEGVYPYRFLPLTVGVDWSPTSFADKQEWVP